MYYQGPASCCATFPELGSILTFTSWLKTAAGTPAISCIFDQEEGGRERRSTTVLPHQGSQLPLRVCP